MKYLPPPLCFHPAPTFSPSPRPVLLSRRGAHGDRQGALRQVWAGAVAAHAVHIGKEVAAHLLAGTAPTQTLIMTSSKSAETRPWVGCCLVSRQLVGIPVPIFFLPFRCLCATVPSTVTWDNRLATWRPARLWTVSTCSSCPTTIPFFCHFWVRLMDLWHS